MHIAKLHWTMKTKSTVTSIYSVEQQLVHTDSLTDSTD